MSSTMMMERTGVAMPGLGFPGVSTSPVGTPTTGPSSMMVPRCTFKVEKCQGGFKVYCSCEDKMACSMVQNLCTMLAGGLCSCCVMLNGMTVCGYNFTLGMTKCEMTPEGVCFTCTSGDPKCGEMIQSCCDCLTCMLDAGCSCYFMLNNTPVCCGTVDPKSVKSKPVTK
jgi:hypothetical protein